MLIFQQIIKLKLSKNLYFQCLILFDLNVFAIQSNFIYKKIALRYCVFIINLLFKL